MDWDDDTIPVTLDEESGRLGIRIGGHWISTERAVALAWILRSEHSKNEVLLNGYIHADNIEWEAIDDGWCILKDGCRERWKPLNWRYGAVRCNYEYTISTQDRLMNKESEITHTGHMYISVTVMIASLLEQRKDWLISPLRNYETMWSTFRLDSCRQLTAYRRAMHRNSLQLPVKSTSQLLGPMLHRRVNTYRQLIL